MIALVTGASSGIGREIAVELSNRGYDLIVVARREERLKELKKQLKTDVEIFVADLEKEAEVFRLCDHLKHVSLDVAVNNAGFGLCGEFCETDLSREIEMISLNIRCLHILTKFFVQKFVEVNRGIILNVASSAAFLPGPYMATYYATKAYVLRLSLAVGEELAQKKSNVRICTLCPGPVKTEFDHVANVTFSLKGLDCRKVAKYTVKKMLAGKKVIVPGTTMKLARVASKLFPDSISVKFAGRMQKKKLKDKK